jgi:hypothetical protein
VIASKHGRTESWLNAGVLVSRRAQRPATKSY